MSEVEITFNEEIEHKKNTVVDAKWIRRIFKDFIIADEHFLVITKRRSTWEVEEQEILRQN